MATNSSVPPSARPVDLKTYLNRRPTYSHLSVLVSQSLYIAIYVRTATFEHDNFHWAFYLHDDETSGGTKYHIILNSRGQYYAKHARTTGICRETNLIGLYWCGEVDPEMKSVVVSNLVYHDMFLREIPNLSCKTWAGTRWERLRERSVVVKGTWEECQREVCEFGNEHWDSASRNEQPRPIGYSLTPRT